MSRKWYCPRLTYGLIALLFALLSGCATTTGPNHSAAQGQPKSQTAPPGPNPGGTAIAEGRISAAQSPTSAAHSAKTPGAPGEAGPAVAERLSPARGVVSGTTPGLIAHNVPGGGNSGGSTAGGANQAVSILPLPPLPPTLSLPTIPEPALLAVAGRRPAPTATPIESVRIALNEPALSGSAALTPGAGTGRSGAAPAGPVPAGAARAGSGTPAGALAPTAAAPFASGGASAPQSPAPQPQTALPPVSKSGSQTASAAGSTGSPASAARGTAVSPAPPASAPFASGGASVPRSPAMPPQTPQTFQTSQTALQAPSPQGAAAPPAAQTAAGAAAHEARTVYARVGDDITIALDGEGWTFTGGGSSGDRWKSGVRYESRIVNGGGTTFNFKATALGKWTLAFSQQNASSGTTANQVFNVDVLTSAEFSRTLAEKRSGFIGKTLGAAGGSSHPALAAADWLYQEGEYAKALDAYEKAWQPNDPALTQKIAELAYRVGRYSVAKKYWQKNFDLTGTPYAELAVAGLMKTATALKDTPELRALFSYVRKLNGVPIRSDLLAAGRFLYDSKTWEVALRYLKEYLARYSGQTGADVADYLLGEIYLGNTPMQNAQTALRYFQDIVAAYPTSEYYERARANIAYLNRNFFQIR